MKLSNISAGLVMNARTYRTSFLKVVMWDSVLSLIAPILLFSLNPKITWAELLVDWRFSWVYSNFIGGIAFMLVPTVWMASCTYPQWIRWIARVSSMFGACVAGSLISGLIFVALPWQPLTIYWPQFLGSLKLAALLTIGA